MSNHWNWKRRGIVSSKSWTGYRSWKRLARGRLGRCITSRIKMSKTRRLFRDTVRKLQRNQVKTTLKSTLPILVPKLTSVKSVPWSSPWEWIDRGPQVCNTNNINIPLSTDIIETAQLKIQMAKHSKTKDMLALLIWEAVKTLMKSKLQFHHEWTKTMLYKTCRWSTITILDSITNKTINSV